jgi:outer membrane lipoprotein-sorting protein
MRKYFIVLTVATFTFFAADMDSFSAELKPKEILHRADEARGNLKGVQWKVHLHSIERGLEQSRSLNVKARGYDFLAVLTAPPKVKMSKLLMTNHNMWFWKPGTSKPVPVSSRQKLLGRASYGDIAATNYADDYEASLLKDETANEELCYVFDLKAKTKKATYDRIKYWISQKRTVGVKAEYYTVSGKLFKTAIFEYNNQILLDNKPNAFISKMIVYDVLSSSDVTTMSFSKSKLVEVPPSVLNVNLLNIM